MGFLITKFQCGGLEVFLCQKTILRSDIPPPFRCQSQTQVVTCTSDQLVTKQSFLQGPLQVLLLKQFTELRKTFYLLDNCIIFIIKGHDKRHKSIQMEETPGVGSSLHSPGSTSPAWPLPWEDMAERHLSARKLPPEPSHAGTLISDF